MTFHRSTVHSCSKCRSSNTKETKDNHGNRILECKSCGHDTTMGQNGFDDGPDDNIAFMAWGA